MRGGEIRGERVRVGEWVRAGGNRGDRVHKEWEVIGEESKACIMYSRPINDDSVQRNSDKRMPGKPTNTQ